MQKKWARKIMNSGHTFSPELINCFSEAEQISQILMTTYRIDYIVYVIIKNFENNNKMKKLTRDLSSSWYWDYMFANRKQIEDDGLERFINSLPRNIEINQINFLEYFFSYSYQKGNKISILYYRGQKYILKLKADLKSDSLDFIDNEDKNILINLYKHELKIENGEDLTFKAYNGDFEQLYGREKELKHIKRILCKKLKNNPLLLGEPGVGKTHIIRQLAIDIVNGNVPNILIGSRIISMSINSMIGGSKYRGELELKVKEFFDSIKNENVIVFIDEVHLIEKNSSEGSSLGDCIKEYFLKPEYKIIGATTYGEYRILEYSPAIQRRFEIVDIEEPTISQATFILSNSKSYYESHYGINIDNDIIKYCVEYSDRYILESALPDKAFNLLDETCSYVVYELSETSIKKQHILNILTQKTGIPIEDLNKDSKSKLLNLKTNMMTKIVGQDEAIERIVRTLKKARLDIGNPNKPMGTFLFAGKTGVGKTEVAKALSEVYFSKKNSLIRIDMSEYRNKESVQRLIGTAPGYIGYKEGGQLTEAVKHNPYSLILFDEIEKAHSDVLNILLQILDEGRLTDGKGKTVNFKNTLIILTTNIGAEIFQKKFLGFGDNSNVKKRDALEVIKKSIRPELFNRIDEVIVFNSLSREDCEIIVKNYMNSFSKKILDKKGIHINYSNDICSYIVKIGFSEDFGAREIIRVFEKEVVYKIADVILEYDIVERIYVKIEDEELKLSIDEEDNTVFSNAGVIALA